MRVIMGPNRPKAAKKAPATAKATEMSSQMVTTENDNEENVNDEHETASSVAEDDSSPNTPNAPSSTNPENEEVEEGPSTSASAAAALAARNEQDRTKFRNLLVPVLDAYRDLLIDKVEGLLFDNSDPSIISGDLADAFRVRLNSEPSIWTMRLGQLPCDGRHVEHRMYTHRGGHPHSHPYVSPYHHLLQGHSHYSPRVNKSAMSGSGSALTTTGHLRKGHSRKDIGLTGNDRKPLASSLASRSRSNGVARHEGPPRRVHFNLPDSSSESLSAYSSPRSSQPSTTGSPGAGLNASFGTPSTHAIQKAALAAASCNNGDLTPLSSSFGVSNSKSVPGSLPASGRGRGMRRARLSRTTTMEDLNKLVPRSPRTVTTTRATAAANKRAHIDHPSYPASAPPAPPSKRPRREIKGVAPAPFVPKKPTTRAGKKVLAESSSDNVIPTTASNKPQEPEAGAEAETNQAEENEKEDGGASQTAPKQRRSRSIRKVPQKESKSKTPAALSDSL